jgi:hypothetical protein
MVIFFLRGERREFDLGDFSVRDPRPSVFIKNRLRVLDGCLGIFGNLCNGRADTLIHARRHRYLRSGT